MTDPRKRGVPMWSDKGRRLIERGPAYTDQPDRPDGPDDPPESARCCVCRSIWPVRGCEFCPDGEPRPLANYWRRTQDHVDRLTDEAA